ncbi:ATP-binding protein [Pseudodesulfovibrio senegalensis]|uniref:histidine kinase n=1 Tax=Pseudodesulfovibrio senegalensis TaxID=1721087 RepID=A0A6N6MXW9_9BACT|nr:PAS domain-containing sensor histidine kinase [Pseudodesulfovibrio senegalensis]KAB1438957.1 GHKL domain-containing protein [Pseudodesulfovibrio senegalensis]
MSEPEINELCIYPKLTHDAVCEQHREIMNSGALALAGVLPYMTLLLNRSRQIVYCNQAVLDSLGLDSMQEVLGRCVGEVFGCIHAEDAPEGCGFSAYCVKCGALKALAKGVAGEAGAGHCRMLRHAGNGIKALNVKVNTSPIEVAGMSMVVLTARNEDKDVRRRAMERLFFHDVLNLAGGLDGAMQSFAEEFQDVNPELAELMQSTARFLLEEIRAQKTLMAAESGDLLVRPEPVSTRNVTESAAALYAMHKAAQGVRVLVAEDLDDVELLTDRLLLNRLLGNMLKNALEATSVGQSVTVGCDRLSDGAAFWVHNPDYIPRDVQLQIFNRSFSTKGEGRGLGTYSIKLLAETYLGGKVSFRSHPEDGTVFTVVLPSSCPR